MATNENLIPIPGRLHSVASDEIVSGAKEIYDDKLSDNLENLNTGFTNNIDTIYNTIGNNNEKGAIMEQLNTIDGRLDTIDGEISALNHIPIEVVQLNSSTGKPNVSNPQENVLYRASNSDHTQYSDWMYKNGSWTMITQLLEPTSLEKLVGYYTCNTEANTPGKEVTTGNSGYVLPVNGGAMKIKMTKTNTANNATLKIGNETAKPLWYNDERASSNNTWEEGEVISVYYDGENYRASNAMGGGSRGIKELRGITGAYIVNNGNTLGSVVNTGGEAAYYQYIKYPVNEGDVVMVSGKGATAGRLWGIVGDNDVMIDKSASNLNGNNLVIIMPEGARYITLNSTIASNPKWYYARKNSAGAREIIDKENIYKGINYLEVGKNYDINEVVLSTDKRLLKIKKSVSSLDLSHIINKRDIKTYNNNTYLAQKNVKEFADTSLTGASTEEPIYSLGSPTKLLLNISRGNCNIEVSFTNGTEIVGNKVNITPSVGYTPAIIATAVYEALSALEDTGWIFTDNSNGSITAEYPATEGYSDYNIVFSASSGITSTSTVSVTSTSTKITMAFSIGVGNISATFKGISYNISIGASTTSSQIATFIAETFANTEGWAFESDGSTVSAICLEAGNNSSTEFKLTDGVLGVTYTLSKPWTGSNTISHFDGIDWTIDTLATYSSSIVFSSNETIDEAWLISNVTEPDSLTKEIIEDEYVISNAFNKQKEDYEKKIIDDEYVIARAVGDHEMRLEKLEGSGNSKYYGVISTSDSDSIAIFGSSFGITSANYVIPSKHWTVIMNMFSDYAIQNVSRDGNDNIDLLSYLRDGTIKLNKNTRFALLVDSENMVNNPYTIYKSFVNLAKAVKSYGVQPILGSSHRNAKSFSFDCQFLSSSLRKWCKENNTIFMDAGEYTAIAANTGQYQSHLNERQSPTVFYAYMDALSGLERPYQSLKVYSLRTGTVVNTLDTLMFNNNFERGKYFVPASQTSTFSNYALITAVIPATSNYLEKLALHVKSSQNVEVYCMDSDVAPYIKPTKYTRFHVNMECVVNSGDKYSYNGTVFTVVYIEWDNPYGDVCDIYCSNALSAAGDVEGTLTKVSGNGTSSITFNGYGIASLSETDSVLNETGGHWAQISKDAKDNYIVPSTYTTVFYDTVYFLIKNDGSFTISELYVEWGASREKLLVRTPVPDFTSNMLNSNQEIITESSFGSNGTVLSTWTDASGNALTSVSSTGLPNRFSSVIPISNTNIMKCTIPANKFKNGKAVIEILARNNPGTVTSTSWDWNTLYIGLAYDASYRTVYEEPVGLAWKIVRIPIETIGIVGGFNYCELRLYAETDNMEIVSVSFKYI